MNRGFVIFHCIVHNKTARNTAISFFIGLAVLCLTVAVFYFKSFYPYALTFQSNSQLALLVDTQALTNALKVPMPDNAGDTFYIDAVDKSETAGEEQLVFTGRYYTLAAADLEKKHLMVEAIIGHKLNDYITESSCHSMIDLTKKNTSEQLLTLKAQKKLCSSSVASQFKESFKLKSFAMEDSGRMKKIFFTALMITIFFSALSFTFLEAFGD